MTTRLTDEERERLAEVYWDAFRQDDGLSPGWLQLTCGRTPYPQWIRRGVDAVITAYLADHAGPEAVARDYSKLMYEAMCPPDDPEWQHCPWDNLAPDEIAEMKRGANAVRDAVLADALAAPDDERGDDR